MTWNCRDCGQWFDDNEDHGCKKQTIEIPAESFQKLSEAYDKAVYTGAVCADGYHRLKTELEFARGDYEALDRKYEALRNVVLEYLAPDVCGPNDYWREKFQSALRIDKWDAEEIMKKKGRINDHD